MFGFLLRLIPGFSSLVALAQFAVGIMYPTYESFKAIESTGSRDDTQWLSYWVVFAAFNFVESFLWVILRWIPMYGVAKVAGLAWLTLPQFRGASFVYTTYVRPVLLALIDQAKGVPAIEPYVRDFNTGAPGIIKKVGDAADDAMANLKTHAQ